MKVTSRKLAPWTLPLVLAVWPTQLVGEAVSRSVQQGVYSKAQASRGRKHFQELCRSCHETKEFRGDYMDAWSGRTAFDLFDLLQSTMPEEAPGVAGPEVYTDILAYMFRLGELPAGEEELESNEEALKRVLIEGPFGGDDGG